MSHHSLDFNFLQDFEFSQHSDKLSNDWAIQDLKEQLIIDNQNQNRNIDFKQQDWQSASFLGGNKHQCILSIEKKHILKQTNLQYQQDQKKSQLSIVSRNKSKTEQKIDKRIKNSNAIKKFGRIIIDNKQWYNLPDGSQNKGFIVMQAALLSNQKKTRVCDRRDNFSTRIYDLLINTEDLALNSFNLQKTQKLIAKQLRKNVLQSKQINNQHKIVYLNALKGLSLRCVSNKLALRLQMPIDK